MTEPKVKFEADPGEAGLKIVNFRKYLDDENPTVREVAALAIQIQSHNYLLRMALAGVQERLTGTVDNIEKVMDRKGGA